MLRIQKKKKRQRSSYRKSDVVITMALKDVGKEYIAVRRFSVPKPWPFLLLGFLFLSYPY